MKNKGKSLIKILLYIIKSPLYLLKGIRAVFLNIFKGVKFSIRRKITLNYLSLYTVIGIVTFVFMIAGFMRYELL